MSKRDRKKEARLRRHYKRRRAQKRYMEYVRFLRQGLEDGEEMSDELLELRNQEWRLLRQSAA